MKKFLLSLALVLGLCTMAQAEEVAFYASDTYSGSAATSVQLTGDIPGTAFTAEGICSLQLTKVSSSTSNVTGGLLRWYKSDIITLTPAAGVTITQVFIQSSSGYMKEPEASVGTVTSDASAYTFTWTGSTDEAFTLTASNGQIRCSSITVTYTKGEAPAVSKPSISIGYDNKVTISSTQEGVKLYYTTDGTEPSTSSTEYTEPFALDAAATVKAIAALNGETSDVASSNLTPYPYVDGINGVTALASGAVAVIQKPITVAYQNGGNCWAVDSENNYLLIYGDYSNKFTPGDVIASLICSYSPYNGLPEVKPIKYGDITTGGDAPQPTEASISALTTADVNKYVVVKDVAISNVTDNKTFTITSGEATLSGNNSYYNTTSTSYTPVVLPEAGAAKADITGFVSVSNSTVQLVPIKVDVTEENLAKPTYSLDTENKVTLAHETEGAVIYYTTDGTEPTTSSAQYSEPIAISEKTTIKALAVADGKTSAVVSFEITPYTVYTSVAEFIKDAPTSAVILNAGLTAIYQSGVNTYAVDSNDKGIVIYNKANSGFTVPTIENGSQFGSFLATYASYSGLPEVVPASDLTITGTVAAVEPTELAIEELASDDLSKYVKIVDATIENAKSSSTAFDISDETGSVKGYNAFGLEIETYNGSGLTIVGFTTCYTSNNTVTLQVAPVSIDASAAKVVCATPAFNPAAGKVASGTEVAISSSTEDAIIYYTTDGTEPTINSTEYTAPIAITEDVTIKAIAVKEGCENSEVATAAYTVLSADARTATFNFTDPTTLNPSITPADPGTNGAGVNIDDKTFVSENISISFVTGTASNAPRIWTSNSNATDFRIYKGSTMTIAGDGTVKSIDDITFTKDGGNFAFTPDSGTFASGKWTPGDEAATSVVLTMTNTTRISTLTVNYTITSSGVSNIAVDGAECAPVYYNLQGVRVANPTPGLYIVRQGNKVSKQLVR